MARATLASPSQPWIAYGRLDAGRPKAALRVLGPRPNGASVVAESIELVAEGMLLERRGEPVEAQERFEAAFERGVPLAALLRECGRHFKRAGRYERAYHCLSLARPLVPGAMKEFLEDLPPAEICRYSPLAAPRMLRGGKVRSRALEPVRAALGDHLGESGAALVLERFTAPSEPVASGAEARTAADGRLRIAYGKLAAGEPAAALRALEPRDDPSGVVAESIELVAEGMLLERRGESVEAQERFEAAFERGVPLAALLRECGRHFKRAGRYERAYHCLSLARPLVPDALKEFLDDLPSAEVCRYSALSAPRMLTASQPRFYAVAPVKRALVSELGEDDATFVLAQFMERGAPWQTARLRLVGLHDHAREQAVELDELIAPKAVRMSPPPVFGGPQLEPISGRTRSFFFCVLPDVVVSSKSNLLVAGDRVLMDFQGDERERVPVDLDVDPIVIREQQTHPTVLLDEESGREAKLERAFSLVGVHSHNFGHWVFEQMFKVWANLDRPGFESVPLLIDEKMPPQLREVLELFVGPEHPIVVLDAGASVEVERLWTCSTIAYWPAGEKPGAPAVPEAELADTAELAELIRSARSQLDDLGHRSGHERLYLTRKGHRLANRPEVERWFLDRGWAIVDLAELPFVEQLERIRGAELVVAEGGSSIYNLLFARPGLRIGVLTVPPPREYEWFNEMFRALGHRLLVLTGEVVRDHPLYASMSDFRIDLEQLPGFLDELGAMP